MVQFLAGVGRQKKEQVSYGTRAQYIATERYCGDIRGDFAKVLKNYEALIRKVGKASPEIILEALRPTFELSQTYVPEDTGFLKRSGHLEIDGSGPDARVRMGYNKDGKVWYAVLVHEMVNIPHKAPTRSKFLLAALEEDQKNIQKRLTDGYLKAAGVR